MDIKIQILVVVVFLAIMGGFLYFTEITKCDGEYDILSLTCNQPTSTTPPVPTVPPVQPTVPPEEELMQKYGLKGDLTPEMKAVSLKIKNDDCRHKLGIKEDDFFMSDIFNKMLEAGKQNGYEKINEPYGGMGTIAHFLYKGLRINSDGKTNKRTLFNFITQQTGYCDQDPASEELKAAADPECPYPCTLGLDEELISAIN